MRAASRAANRAVEIEPTALIAPIEITSVKMVEDRQRGDDETGLKMLVALVYRLKRGCA